jgi:hypothetical protein
MSAGCRTIHARYFAITLAARSVATDDERIAPFAGAADIDAIRRRASANLSSAPVEPAAGAAGAH